MSPSSRVGICLDVGAGSAPHRKEISKYFAASHYIAVDFVPGDSLDVIADARALPIRDQSVDLLVCLEVLQHILEYNSVFDEIQRILCPGGFLLVSFPFIYGECGVVDFRRWTVAGMVRELESRGHIVLIVERFGGVFYAINTILIWAIQHLVPGSRATWRSPRNVWAYCREGVVTLLTFPLVLLSWVAIAVDSLLPELGCYMGSLIFSRRAANRTTSDDG